MLIWITADRAHLCSWVPHIKLPRARQSIPFLPLCYKTLHPPSFHHTFTIPWLHQTRESAQLKAVLVPYMKCYQGHSLQEASSPKGQVLHKGLCYCECSAQTHPPVSPKNCGRAPFAHSNLCSAHCSEKLFIQAMQHSGTSVRGSTLPCSSSQVAEG